MLKIDWQTVATLVSAGAAIIAAGLTIYTVRKTLWMSALIALEERFSRINHAKIANPEAWESILQAGELAGTAKHLVFETFVFYHQAFLLHKRRAISDIDYSIWSERMEKDLELFVNYRKWWESDLSAFHTAWDQEFIKKVNSILRKLKTTDCKNETGH